MTYDELMEEKKSLEHTVAQLVRENMLLRQKQEKGDILFSDWILQWLEKKRMTVKQNTFDIYEIQVNVHIEPYFRERQLKLNELTPSILEKYYCDKFLSGLGGNTIRKHHCNIHSALKDAVKNDLIASNPDDLAERPLVMDFTGNALTSDELHKVFSEAKNTKIFLPVLIAGTMGLRRSEVLGLRWSDIDFQAKSITVQHTVVQCRIDGKRQLVFSDVMKTKTSKRTLPVPDKLLNTLVVYRNQQMKFYSGNRHKYCRKYLKYICVHKNGELIKPDYLSRKFHELILSLEYNCRFHDLRHTCASLLVQSGVPLKSVSIWLGHCNISITSDIYAHLTFKEKIDVLNMIESYI